MKKKTFVVEPRFILKNNAGYDDFQAVLERDCHCGKRHVVAPSSGKCWDLFLKVKACLQIVKDANLTNRDVVKFGLEAVWGDGKLRLEAEEKLRKM